MLRVWGVMVGLFVCLGIGLMAGYAIGHVRHAHTLSYDAGYSRGWMDAHCGVGGECEGGQE